MKVCLIVLLATLPVSVAVLTVSRQLLQNLVVQLEAFKKVLAAPPTSPALSTVSMPTIAPLVPTLVEATLPTVPMPIASLVPTLVEATLPTVSMPIAPLVPTLVEATLPTVPMPIAPVVPTLVEATLPTISLTAIVNSTIIPSHVNSTTQNTIIKPTIQADTTTAETPPVKVADQLNVSESLNNFSSMGTIIISLLTTQLEKIQEEALLAGEVATKLEAEAAAVGGPLGALYLKKADAIVVEQTNKVQAMLIFAKLQVNMVKSFVKVTISQQKIARLLPAITAA